MEKPAILKFYDFSKGGTDIVDQRIGFYTVNTKSRRWSMAAFAYILDTARINAQTIYSINKSVDPRKSKSFEFGWELVMSLITPHINTRKSVAGLPRRTITKMNMVLNLPDLQQTEQQEQFTNYSEKPNRCSICIENIERPDVTSKCRKLSTMKSRCCKCGNTCCKNHMMHICNKCSNRN